MAIIVSGDPTITGTNDNDTITGTNGLGVTVFGLFGDDTITTGAGNDFVIGGGGNDTISTGAGHDTVSDEGGNDRIITGSGNDEVNFALGLGVDVRFSQSWAVRASGGLGDIEGVGISLTYIR